MSPVNPGTRWPSPKPSTTPATTPTTTPEVRPSTGAGARAGATTRAAPHAAAATTVAAANQPSILGSGSRADADAYVPRRILVLGATSGIAEACCRLWADRGDSLHLVGRNPDRLKAVAADVRTRGARVVTSTIADLEDTRAHPELLADAIDRLGGLDIAFFAHGVLGDQREAERSFAAAVAILHNNLVSMVSLLTWLANYCVQQHAGTLAVLSSVAGDRGRKSNYVYGASKAGLSAFVDGLRNRVDREGVRVMTIKPGPVKTAMTEGMKGSAKFADVEKVAASLVKAIDRGDDVVYVPGIWRIIMSVIQLIPERLFKKLDL